MTTNVAIPALTFVADNPVFNLTIPWWPAVILLALAWSLFLPDRYSDRGLRRWDNGPFEGERFITRGIACALWLVALLWFVPAYMTTPGAAGFDTGAVSLVEGTQGYWPAVAYVVGREYGWVRHTGWTMLVLAAYAAVGLVWAIAFFWIYARRLSHIYVQQRDAWMVEHGVTNLFKMTTEQTREFNAVIAAVQGKMLYRGAFPLKASQQKRFFVANLTLWPLTLVCWLIGDFALDVARGIWFALRGWIHCKWAAGMAQYLQDEAVCQAYLEELKAQPVSQSAKQKGIAALESAAKRVRETLQRPAPGRAS
jgi:hypothetical protein